MVRKIRDKNYEQYKGLSLKEFGKKLSEEARKSDIWKKFAERKTRVSGS
jgi:Mn-dependent DtxR family transcriptional regulator